jgi:hypothetical protein
MKPFQCLVMLRLPADRVGVAIRDRLSEIAPHLDDVESIRTIARAEGTDGAVTLVNEWRVNPKIPPALNGVVTPDMLGWLDHAEWAADLSRCRWRIEPFFMRDAIICEGETRIQPAMGGRGARATFEGKLTIDRSALSSIPVAWRQPAAAAVELVIGALIPKNFRKTTDAVATLFDEGLTDERGVMKAQSRIGGR